MRVINQLDPKRCTLLKEKGFYYDIMNRHKKINSCVLIKKMFLSNVIND